MAEHDIDHDLLARVMRPAIACALDYAARREGIAVEEKTRGQFASEADRAVEEVIRTTLRTERGTVALLGEEGGGALDADGTGWVIDPIDGTTNFLRGLPLWGISIGYTMGGEAVAGVVALPALGEMLSAVRGGGVRRNGVTMQPLAAPSAVKLIAVGENDHEPGTQTDLRAQLLRDEGWAVARYNCAVFSLAGAALGWTDGYIEHGCALWDISAGAVVCREAGLDVMTREIAPGRYAIEARRPR